MGNPLRDWLDVPDRDAGVSAYRGGGSWSTTSYEEIRGLVAATAERCAEVAGSANAIAETADAADPAGPTGATIAVCCADPATFVTALFAALAVGARVCCLPPPGLGARSSYASLVGERIRALRPTVLLGDRTTGPALSDLGLPDATTAVTVADRPGTTLPDPALADRASVLQFTSGSSSAGKGIVIPAAALSANVSAIIGWLGLGPGDGTSSWLPQHHDMGLIGCLLTPVAAQVPLWLMAPRQFVREPQEWLRTFERGATTTAAPPFGYEHCVGRVPADLRFDFARWRVAIIGAERIRDSTLRAFAERFGADGFDPEAFRPSYGLAEATLAVTGRSPRDPVRTLHLDASADAVARPDAGVQPGSVVQPSSGSTAVLGCGRPLEGCAVEIRGPGGDVLGPGQVGEIVVRSPALGSYVTPDEDGGTRFEDGRLWTSDLGFVDDGELFCIGRAGEALKVRGVFLSAESVESAVADRLGMPTGSVVALLGHRGGPSLALLLDERLGAVSGQVRAAADTVTAGAGIETTVCVVPHRLIERTSSGKPRRRVLWRGFTKGRFDAYLASESASESAAELEPAPGTVADLDRDPVP